MKKTRYPVMNMGTVSILTIFIVLCMVTFATLSFISTNKDAAFTRQIADRTTAYYAASSEANRQIAGITEQLKLKWENGTYAELRRLIPYLSLSMNKSCSELSSLPADRMRPKELTAR